MSIPNEYIKAAEEMQRRLATGDAQGAVYIGEQLTKAVPNYTGVYVLLGRAYRQLGDSVQALARFRTAAELAPRDASRWLEFVDELLKDGQKGRARKVAQKAPLKGPDKKRLMDLARKGRGQTGPATGGIDQAALSRLQNMLSEGKATQARSETEDLLKEHPDSAFLHNLRGVAALAERDTSVAVECFRRTLELSPDFAGAAANLGLALVRQRDFDSAIKVLQNVVSFDPSSLEARTNLANAYLDAGYFPQAAEAAGEVLKLAKDDRDGLKILVSAHLRSKDYAAARDVIDQLEMAHGRDEWTVHTRFEAFSEDGLDDAALAFANEQLETFPALASPLSRVLAQIGDLEGAQNLLRKAIERDPSNCGVLYRYSQYTKWREDDPLLPILKDTAAGVDHARHDADAVFHALGKAQLDLGQYDAAFASYKTANQLQGQKTTFDLAYVDKQRRAIQARWTSETLERLKGAGVESIAPIFIVGMPRSGSTLLDHVISAHPDVVSIGEDSFTNADFPFDLAAERNALVSAARAGAKEARRLSGPDVRLLDKFLNNFMRVGSLAAAYPRAKFVQTVRDPRAIALSIFTNRMKVNGHPYSADLVDIAEYYKQYHAYMEHWKSVLGSRVIAAEYQQLVENPEPEIRTLIERLDLEWNDACLKPEAVQKRVKTLSVAQVRSGIHTKSVERWKRHEADLEPFSKVLRAAGLL